MMGGDLDTLSEHTGMGVVSILLKNRFSSVASSRLAAACHLFHPIPHLLRAVLSHLATISL